MTLTHLQHPASTVIVPRRIVIRGLPDDKTLSAFIQRRLEYALERFTARVRDIEVFIEDVNGPRRGVDKRCRIEVRLNPRGAFTVTADAENEYAAVSRATRRCATVLNRSIKRRRDSRYRRAG